LEIIKTANVDTADQGKLIIIAYDVAIKHCRLAIEKFKNKKDIEERTKHLFKVQDAISELMGSLKLEVGEIANFNKTLKMALSYARNKGNSTTVYL
jgi:flagellar protein FliS